MRQKSMTPGHVMMLLRLRLPRATQGARQRRVREARPLTPVI